MTTQFLTKDYEPHTQKARGINALETFKYWFGGIHCIDQIIFSAKEDLSDKIIPLPVFARPCPTQPRHGFVDSRVVSTTKQLQDLCAETLAADPNGELVLMPVISSTHSAVLANSLLSVGRGNTGVTGGGKAITLPVINSMAIQRARKYAIEQKLITNDEALFLELVYDGFKEKQCKIVQARSAPAGAVIASPDFIPRDMTIKKVVQPDPEEINLLDWEKQMKKMDPNGTVVYLPDTSLSSHLAIHAITNEITVLTNPDYTPTVGDNLKKSTETHHVDYTNVLDGFQKAINLTMPSDINPEIWFGQVAKNVLALTHNTVALLSENKGFEIGVAAGLLSKVTFMLGAGEARYYKGKSHDESEREKRYIKAFQAPSELINKAIDSHNKFVDMDAWGGSYGGTKWASIVAGGIKVWNAALSGNVNALILEMNKTIQLQHNSSWFMNKIVGYDEYTHASQDAAAYAIRIAPALYEILVALESVQTKYEPVVIDEKLLLEPFHSGGGSDEEDEEEDEDVEPCSCSDCNPKVTFSTNEVQIRLLDKLVGSLRLQAGKAEKDILFSDLTKQAKDVITHTVATSPSKHGSAQLYIPMQLKGKSKKWWTINDKRILSEKKLNQLLGV